MPENCNDCPLTPRLEALERANERHGKTHAEFYNRLNALERGEAAQAEQYKAILDKLDALTRRHDELNRKLGELESKPGKRWDKVIETVLAVIVTGVVCFLLGRVGL